MTASSGSAYSGAAIEVRGLIMEYKGREKIRAIDGVDLAVPEGTVMGLLGPNGAGKTTTVRIITTLLRPSAGVVRVCGIDVVAQPMRVRKRIGLSGQYAAVDEHLTGFENLRMVARLYGMSRKHAADRAEELLAAFGLEGSRNARAGTYSGGMRRRLDLAGSLVARPSVVVLDEPTTGLDPRARKDMWQVIADLVADGTTVLLTTQYLEEADQLANAITVIDHGKVIACGRPDELKATIGGERLTVTLGDMSDVPAAMRVLSTIGIGIPTWIEMDSDNVTVPVGDGTRSMVEALRRLEHERIEVVDARVARPTLDQVFFALTGAQAEKPGPDDKPTQQPDEQPDEREEVLVS